MALLVYLFVAFAQAGGILVSWQGWAQNYRS